ncbi:MAG: BCD family MFS transporter [Brevefilum sp.]|nr:BCD family MFS transporter [Brevefilum sp.]
MKSSFFEQLRLAGFPLGLGLVSVLVSGTLNRVMIVEMNIPASLVGLFFALPLLISPLRIWLGYRSDAYPIWGLRREPLILFGSLLAGLGVSGATLALVQTKSLSALIVGMLVLAFVAYGFGKNLSSNTFEALLADKFVGDQRPRAVTFYKVAMFVGIMLGALLLGRLLDPYAEMRLLVIVVSTAVGTFLLTIVSIARQEPREAAIQSESQEARGTAFWTTFKTMIWADPQIRRFFIFVMLTVIGTLAQDVLLEPYAALVLNMSVGETTRLTAIWGAGTLLSMGAAGAWLIKRYGYVRVVRVGLLLGILTFLGLILSGALELTTVFLLLVFFLGVSTGLSASGMLSAVIDFTTAERAGLLMGVWGVAHNLGQAAGNLVSGTLVDIIRALQGDALTAYGLVFALEAVLLLAALWLLKDIKISEARILAALRQREPDAL